MLPFFKKSMHFTPPSKLRAANSTAMYSLDDYSPTGGPLQLSYPKYATPFGEYAIRAMRAAGFPALKGFSSGDLHGVSFNVSMYHHHPVTQKQLTIASSPSPSTRSTSSGPPQRSLSSRRPSTLESR